MGVLLTAEEFLVIPPADAVRRELVRGEVRCMTPAGGSHGAIGANVYDVPLAPDLAVEVLSPSETASDVEEKLADYRAAGTSLVWVVDPTRRLVAVYADDAPTRWLREGDALDGAGVVPGFTLPVEALFEDVADA